MNEYVLSRRCAAWLHFIQTAEVNLTKERPKQKNKQLYAAKIKLLTFSKLVNHNRTEAVSFSSEADRGFSVSTVRHWRHWAPRRFNQLKGERWASAGSQEPGCLVRPKHWTQWHWDSLVRTCSVKLIYVRFQTCLRQILNSNQTLIIRKTAGVRHWKNSTCRH